MGQLKIELLGEFCFEYNGGVLAGVDSQRMQSLLAYLLIHRAAPQSRRYVAGVFWPDSSEDQSTTNLRNLLSKLREAWPDWDQFLSDDRRNLQWRLDAPYVLDVEEFEKAVKQKDSIEALEQAVDLYRGGLFPGCYDDWVLPERLRLEGQFMVALERLIVLLEGNKEYRRALTYAERLGLLDPLREEAYRIQMRLYGSMGDRAAVKRVYELCRRVLKEALGNDVEPSAETQEAYRQATRSSQLPRLQGSMVSVPTGTGTPSASPAPADPSVRQSVPVRISSVNREPNSGIVQRRLTRAIKPYITAAEVVVNYSIPVILLVVLVEILHAALVTSVVLSAVLYVGLYFVLNPRSRKEQAKHELREDIDAELDKAGEQSAHIRRIGLQVQKPEVAARITGICDAADRIIEKLAADPETSLAAATRVESVLLETSHILDLYLQIQRSKVVAHPDRLENTIVKIEQDLLNEIESSLLDFQVKLDQADMIELEVSIRVMLKRLKLEGLE